VQLAAAAYRAGWRGGGERGGSQFVPARVVGGRDVARVLGKHGVGPAADEPWHRRGLGGGLAILALLVEAPARSAAASPSAIGWCSTWLATVNSRSGGGAFDRGGLGRSIPGWLACSR
jgi:hypothetical protein